MRASGARGFAHPRRSRRPRLADDRMLPLINIVFLLLIFFMVVGRLSSADPFAIEPTVSISDERAEIEPLVILVAADGRFALGGDLLTQEALLDRVASQLIEDPETEVRLKVDARSDAANVVELLERLRQVGVDRVRFITTKVAR